MNVRDKILKYIKEKDISLKELSQMANINSEKIESVFARKRDLSVKNYVRICKCLNLDISYFL